VDQLAKHKANKHDSEKMLQAIALLHEQLSHTTVLLVESMKM
jgi:hypothetical protein